MARGFIRKPSFWRIVGAYRSQWKRSLMRALFPNTYGKKGMGWWINPRKAAYNWWYRRTSVSAYDFGMFRRTRPSRVWVECAIGVGLLCSIFLLPIDVPVASRTGHKIKKQRLKRTAARIEREKARRQRSEQMSRQETSTGAARSNSSPQRTETIRHNRPQFTASGSVSDKGIAESKKEPKPKPETKPEKAPKAEKVPKQEKASAVSYTPVIPTKPIEIPKPQPPVEPDENTPKSKPRNESDQYIRKRMIVAGSYYCDQAVISQLTVGAHIDLVAEPTNPHDKNAVALLYQGSKIGYVAKADAPAFVTCLKLRRPVYGVVTDIRETDGRKQIEYETWFEKA